MYIVNSYSVAVVLLFITMLCWGSWANTQKLASKKWAFQHFYWDYTIGMVLFSILAALTMGSVGEQGRSFLADIAQADTDSIKSAFIGGVVFNFSNILLVIAIEIAGMAVAFPVGIGLALVIGVFVNYFAVPSGDPVILFAGVAFVTIAIIVNAFAYKKMQSKDEKSKKMVKGIAFSVLTGIAMGFFFRFVAASMSTDFVQPQAGKMTPYTAMLIFSIGVFISNFLWNTIVMYRPITGSKATYSQYFKEGNSKLHLIGMLGGVIWSIGMLFNLIASGATGFAISYGLGQGATLVSAIWGVFIWKEFKSAPKSVNKYLGMMFLCFIIGISLIILAKI